MSNPEIHCPSCKWRPDGRAHWMCLPVCATSWNTFATGGVCPACGEVFEHTQCPVCHMLSPHEDWYHMPDDERATAEAEADALG